MKLFLLALGAFAISGISRADVNPLMAGVFVKIPGTPVEMAVADITQAQWVALMGTNPSEFKGKSNCAEDYRKDPVAMCPNNPVERVTWTEIQTFLARMNTANDGYTYRLPSEVEWEKASGGPISTCTLGIFLCAWYRDNATGQTRAVSTKAPNSLGVYDLYGNVWQFLQDEYTDVPPEPPGPGGGSSRVIRGCAWNSPASLCENDRRFGVGSGDRQNYVGFRLVRAPAQR